MQEMYRKVQEHDR